MSLLEVIEVIKSFGGLTAVNEVTLDIAEREILGIIGPNGAGKTTLFNVICGFYPADRGKVIYKQKNITGMRPSDICKLGLSKTFQVVKPFSNISVLENVMVGAYNTTNSRSRAYRIAMECLEQVGLVEKSGLEAKHLTMGEQRRLELARVVATGADTLLLDEVMAGLTPTEMKETMSWIQRINESGKTIILIEHVMAAVMSLSKRVAVLHHGRLIAQGKPQEIASNKRVIEAYLGEEYDFARN